MSGWLSIALLLMASVSVRAEGLAGMWVGHATTAREQTSLVLDITGSTVLQTSMTLPDIGVTGWPAIRTEATADGVVVVFPSDSGEQFMRLSRVNDVLKGEWREPRFKEAAMVELSFVKQPVRVPETNVMIQGPAGLLGASLATVREAGLGHWQA